MANDEAKVGVLVIHGVGSQDKGYSKGMRDKVADLMKAANAVAWEEICWAKQLQKREKALWKAMQSAREPNSDRQIPLDWRTTREFIVHNFGDALAYHRDEGKVSACHQIHKTVSAGVTALTEKLESPDSPVVVLAHSLGAHIMSNYIWDRQHSTCTESDHFSRVDSLLGMITFGCNIPLFSLAYPIARPINLPGKKVENLHELSKWLNFFDRDDVLGWPLRPLYERHKDDLNVDQKNTVERIEDHEINVGNPFTASWNPRAHGKYWTDGDFTRPVAEYLEKIVCQV